MPARIHQPDQNVLDYQMQQKIRNAPALGIVATLMTGVFSAWLSSSLAVDWSIGPYAANFFPHYVSKPIFGLDVYSPLALGKAYWHFYTYPMMKRAAYAALGGTLVPTLAMGIWQFLRIGRLQKRLFETDLHGSAHWATQKEVKDMALLPEGKKQTSRRVCYVGGFPDAQGQTQYLQHAGAEHIIAFAPTRSGKGVGLVLPTLLGGWQESTVVHDIKGENYLLTAGWRKSIGQKILKFNPGFGMAADPPAGVEANNGDQGKKDQCCHFNPLEEIRVGTPFEVKDVMNIATMIVDPDGKGLNDHWQKTGFALLTSVILHVLYAEPDKTLRGVAAFLNDPNLQGGVDEAFNKMMATEHDPNCRYRWKDPYDPEQKRMVKVHPVIAQSAKEMLNKAPNEKSGVISTMMSFLSLYRDPIVAEWTEYSDFHVQDLQDAEHPVSLYLVTSPEDKNRLKPLIRLILNLIASKFTSEDRLIEKEGRMVCRGKHPLLLLLDEFPSLGKMDVFQDAIAFFAGYNVKLFLIAQDKSQLEDEAHAYGKAGGQIIINNCHVRVVYAPNEVTTAEWVSKMLGKKTVAMENTTQSLEGSFLPSPKGQSRSITYQARDLLTPDEVLRLRGPVKKGSDIVQAGDMLVLVAGFAPVYGRQILYFKNPVFLDRAKIAPPAHRDTIGSPKNYAAIFGEHGGVLTVPRTAPEEVLDDADFTDTPPSGLADSNGPADGKGPADGTSPADGTGTAGSESSTGNAPMVPRATDDAPEAQEISGDADPDVEDSKKLIAQTALLYAQARKHLPPEILAAAGGADAWMPSQERLDRHGDTTGMKGLMGEKV
ncbi:type IV secretory system conjugative DNA transfer family protein [Acidithiobacillus sp. VAN18-1]|uniref:Type IV secretory system conjugative DNA transfer family protein n=1 Tax=Igneacidithiobacillus copahuensis TaxID=2724909 RepID=A0AAE2YQ97_9PROT|nr:type IV secretory system conjugative DNA transfer family protein [Igneacidithiobacillus copahuensis]MBU2788172.1 type IV secretory system conjugative DNA transfer family protein [Igneacidithiobacillus copahuensis]MBU2797017.1 type IV secretory system conjugative DNA transfer family protein [Acidithiobacillus sp. VAN18-2]